MTAKNSPYPGLFVTLEGGEGAGKSSVMRQLAERLRADGHEVVTTREPGGSQLGEAIRGLLLSDHKIPVGDRAELLLFLAARVQHIEELILPALQQGQIVLCDRFNDSSVAYQGAGRTGNAEKARALCNMVCEDLVPDLTLLLDVDPVEGLARSRGIAKGDASAGDLDRIEQAGLQFHESVRQAFLHMARQEPNRFVVIPADRQLDQAVEECLSAVQDHLARR